MPKLVTVSIHRCKRETVDMLGKLMPSCTYKVYDEGESSEFAVTSFMMDGCEIKLFANGR